jgi:hypothetical protein
LVSPATTESVTVPAEYANRTYQKLVADASTTSSEVPAQYATKTMQKLVSPASTTSSEVPAQYETRTYQKLVSPATTRTVEVPAEYKTITKTRLVKAGGFTEFKEVVCESELTTELIRSVQLALIAKGYSVGPRGADNIFGNDTKTALRKYQADNNLPQGSLDYETLKSLGVKK